MAYLCLSGPFCLLSFRYWNHLKWSSRANSVYHDVFGQSSQTSGLFGKHAGAILVSLAQEDSPLGKSGALALMVPRPRLMPPTSLVYSPRHPLAFPSHCPLVEFIFHTISSHRSSFEKINHLCPRVCTHFCSFSYDNQITFESWSLL